MSLQDINRKIAEETRNESGFDPKLVSKLHRVIKGRTVQLTSKEVDQIEMREGFREGWFDFYGKQIVIGLSGKAFIY